MDIKKSFYKKNKFLFGLTIMIGTIATACTVLYALLLQEMLDVANKGDLSELKRVFLFAILLFVAVFVIQMALKTIRCAFVKKAMVQYKNTAFEIITNKNITSFANENTSSYLSILTNDASYIEDNYLFGYFEIIMQLVSFFGAIALMFWYNWVMTIAVIFSCAIPVAVSLAFGNKMMVLEQSISSKNESFMDIIKDLLSGFFIIKSFQAEKTAIKLFKKENEQVEGEKQKRKNAEGTITVISTEIGSVLQIGVFMVGTYLAIQGHITVGVVIAFVQLMNNIMDPIQSLPALFARRKAAKSLIEKMDNYANSNEENIGATKINNLEDGIYFKDVTFSYNEENKALNKISVKFNKGKSYVIVGESGSGKSTILKLIMRGYLGYVGNILIDKNEIREIDSNSLYKILSIVQQEVFIFNSTIKDNITLYKDFSEEEIKRVIEMSGLTELIKKKGIDFECGENGVNLSGGERQRISIARCLLKNTKILLMDEATSALDAETSKLVLGQILGLDELTRIVITHSLSKETLNKFDEIIVMKNGEIVEKGSYDVLMNNKDYFYSLCSVGS